MLTDHQDLWARCCELIKSNLPPEQYNTWFRDITPVSYDGANLRLQAQSAAFVDQLEGRYQQLLRAAVNRVYGAGTQIYYRYRIAEPDPRTEVTVKDANMSSEILRQVKAAPADPFREPEAKPFDPQLNPKYNFENYCISESNKIARTIGEAIGNDPTLKTFNPLFVFGPSGVGKTHLIQAIGIRIKERNPRARVYYVTARLFQSQYTAANAAHNINAFFHFYQSIDTLIVDDVQDLQNMPGTQNTFFHIFNHLHQHDRQIIMSSDRSPAEMDGFDARMLNRFKWGMQVELERPDLPLRRSVLKLRSEQDGIVLPGEVADFIAANVTSSVRELEGIVTSLMAHATVLNREISVELARRVVNNAVRIRRPQVNFEMIAEAVASHYRISSDLLFTKTRKREISDARQIVMYLAKKMADMPLTAIGKRLDRTHATVSYAIDSIESRLGMDKQLQKDVMAIETGIRS